MPTATACRHSLPARSLVQPPSAQPLLPHAGPLRSTRRTLRCCAEARNKLEEARGAAAGATGAPAAAAVHRVAARVADAPLPVAYQYRKAEDPTPMESLGMLRHKLQAVGRELGAISDADLEQLEARSRSGSGGAVVGAGPAGAPLLQLSVDSLVRTIQQQHAVQLPAANVQQNIVPLAQPTVAPAVPPAAPVPTPAHEPMPMPAASPLKPFKPLDSQPIKPEGTGHEVLLQGFNWDSWKQPGGWYNHLRSRAEELAQLGFTAIWLPPMTQSVSEQGYMPGDLYNLNSRYGSEAELIACVAHLKECGLKVLGDAVLNHRCAQRQDEQGIWNLYGGRMAWDQRAIVGDDPNFRGRGNRSSGDIFSAAPNIDHSQEFVKRDLQEWLVWLRTHVGFDGWRLDFVKGFHGSHVKDYMEASCPQFAVGEYWDTLAYDWDGTPVHNQDAHRQRTVNWINAAGGLSTAFDITLKGIMHAVFERCEYWRLRDGAGKPAGLLGFWPSRAVTFLENHDTGSSQGHWRFPGHAVEQGYAYILTHPGTPCIFWDHLGDQRMRDMIGRLMALRKRNALHCRSQVDILRADRDVYAARIDGKIIMKIGPGDFSPNSCPKASGPKAASGQKMWAIADCGHNWSVWERAGPPLPAEEDEE